VTEEAGVQGAGGESIAIYSLFPIPFPQLPITNYQLPITVKLCDRSVARKFDKGDNLKGEYATAR
jgi:hypothetical protein